MECFPAERALFRNEIKLLRILLNYLCAPTAALTWRWRRQWPSCASGFFIIFTIFFLFWTSASRRCVSASESIHYCSGADAIAGDEGPALRGTRAAPLFQKKNENKTTWKRCWLICQRNGRTFTPKRSASGSRSSYLFSFNSVDCAARTVIRWGDSRRGIASPPGRQYSNVAGRLHNGERRGENGSQNKPALSFSRYLWRVLFGPLKGIALDPVGPIEANPARFSSPKSTLHFVVRCRIVENFLKNTAL